MNDKRDEIRKILTAFSREECLYPECECDDVEVNDLTSDFMCFGGIEGAIDCVMKRLNDLVVIPVEGELPFSTPEHSDEFRNGFDSAVAKLGAGYVLSKKLVEE